MKKFLVTLFLIVLSIQSVNAWEANPDLLYNPMTRDEKAVNRLFKSQVKYANNCNFKKYISTYDKNYINTDGLNLETYAQMVRDIWVNYDDIKYTIDIKSIKVDGLKATVLLKETAVAILPKAASYDGELKSVSDLVYNLENKNGKWKVVSDKILYETTSILYGNAIGLDIDLKLPEKVSAKEEFCASLHFNTPDQFVAIASIASDVIEYPQKQVQEVFRTMPEDNILERLFVANDCGKNEYVVASIGLTETNITDMSIKLSLAGFGYYMKRLNVEH